MEQRSSSVLKIRLGTQLRLECQLLKRGDKREESLCGEAVKRTLSGEGMFSISHVMAGSLLGSKLFSIDLR